MAYKNMIIVLKRYMTVTVMGLLYMVLLSSCSHGRKEAHRLNETALECLWTNLDSAGQYAEMAMETFGAGRQEKAQALNTMARVAFMRMDYVEAWNLYNEILDMHGSGLCMRLTADIGLMRICQRTSDNVAFYEYRNSILLLLRTMHDEESLMSDADRSKMYSLERSFRLESALYYHELEQPWQAGQELAHVESDAGLHDDTDRLLMYLYLKGLGIGLEMTGDFAVEERARNLIQCISSSETSGNMRMKAMACCAMSRLLLDNQSGADLRAMVLDQLPLELKSAGWNTDNMTSMLAIGALEISAVYGAGYEMLLAYRQLAACQLSEGRFADALDVLGRALDLVNSTALQRLEPEMTPLPLELYREDGAIIEEDWMDVMPHSVMPEYLASVRELMSVAWSGLDSKQQSDYNRNVYLEIQKNIRIDRRYEARTRLLEQSNRRLAVLTYAMIAALLLLVAVYVLFLRQVRRSNVGFASLMSETVELCRRILQPVPADGLRQHMDTVVAPSLQTLTQAENVSIGAEGELNVQWPRGGADRDSQAVACAVEPFIRQAFDSVRLLSWQADSLEQASKQHRLYLMHKADSKRGNMVRKTCCQVVAQCLPYIDRMKAQIEKLSQYAPDSREYADGLEYVRELAGCINAYNQVLANWISIRQGLVTLNVSSFALQELFDIVSRGSSSFAMKKVAFELEPTDAVVKADRVLTLFMINTLADNARKYTPEGGKVTISAQALQDCVEISVCDTGIGLSGDDVRRINTEKIIDAGSIGETGGEHGSGFGIMNCKGIIEKYIKSHEMFSVCRFQVESTPGKGSRFSFRLPKGIRRALGLILLPICLAGNVMAASDDSDSLLMAAYDHAYNVYLSNTEGNYEMALDEAVTALDLLNQDYLLHGGQGRLLSLCDSLPPAAELQWIDELFATDYETVLWIRNEVAVSALALKDWELYAYNDKAYIKLFKQYFSESMIEQDCTDLQHVNGNLSVALMLFIVLLFTSMLVLFVVYARHWIRHRSDLKQIMGIAECIQRSLHDINTDNFNVSSTLQTLCDGMFPLMDGLFGLQSLELELDSGRSGKALAVSRNREVSGMGVAGVSPVAVELENGSVRVGRMSISPKGRLNDSMRMELQMIADYLATALQSLLLRFEAGFNDLNQLATESDCMKHEQEQLHVNSMVLDNCLSTLKHETVWYPNRIVQLADSGDVAQMSELVCYYRDIFGILSQQALARTGMQLVQRSEINADALVADVAAGVMGKLHVAVEAQPSGLSFMADDVLVRFLLESLLERGVEFGCSGPILLEPCADGQFVRVEVFFPGISPEPDTLFSALEGRNSMAFVLCSQIIREHDESFGHIGCRINAESRQGGTLVWFTLPLAYNSQKEPNGNNQNNSR